MARTPQRKVTYQEISEALGKYGNMAAAARALGISRNVAWQTHKKGVDAGQIPAAGNGEGVKVEGSGDQCVMSLRSHTVRTLDAALAEGHVDLTKWKVVRWTLNKWDVAAKLATETANGKSEKLTATELWQVKVWFEPRSEPELAISELIQKLKDNSPIRLPISRASANASHRRIFELSVMDPHLGLHCFPKASDRAWSLEDCERVMLWAVDSLLEHARLYLPVEEIIFPFGNDFLHADGVFHTTTAGTPQPEMEAWHHTYVRGEQLAITAIERMREIAPVRVVVVPGNHDRQSAFTLGRLLKAYYHNDPDVMVDADASPYKFVHYGVNLIGFEHGHSVNAQRYAGLMANEMPEAWAATAGGYREWHLGDQHRKGSSKPVTFEEQGVSVEYLPGLTPPNEWHRLKAYNWQKRGAMGWVWDHDHGPLARLQVNLNTWTGEPTGISKGVL